MKKIKKGDIVARKSYGKDILFTVINIIKTHNGDVAILRGLIERVEADSYIEDLEKINSEQIKKDLEKLQNKLNSRVKDNRNYEIKRIYDTGKILHLDGDKKYSEKSYSYYKKLGLKAVVKNIAEYKQPKVIYNLLKIYNPDILVITGHDGMIKKGKGYNDIYNYRNSRYFIETVKKAKEYEMDTNKKIVIFAGACQSYFEALIAAGANFASSPARILIDFLDPLIVAEKVATTDKYKYITVNDFVKELRDGRKGVDGIGSNGTMNIVQQYVTKM
jgi:spore coat assembly protein